MGAQNPSPILFGANNLAGNLENGFLQANGSLLTSNGPKNYITYNNFENALTTGWSLGTVGTLTNNIPTGTPTFGSGASGNLSIGVTPINPLGGIFSLSYSATGATVVGDMLASQAYSIDKEDQAKVLTFKFYYSTPTANSNYNFSGTNSNSFGVAAWDATNSAWLGVAGNFSMTQGTGSGLATGTLQTAINTASIQFVIYNANAVTGTVGLLFDDFFVGPQTAPIGAPVVTQGSVSSSATNSITATTTSPAKGTNSVDYILGYRVGDQARIRGAYVQSAAGTIGSGDYLFLLPNSMSFDSSKVSFYSTVVGAGVDLSNGSLGTAFVSNGSGILSGYILPYDATHFRLFVQGYIGSQLQGCVGSAFFGLNNATYSFSYDFIAPIAGWSSNVQMSNDTDTRVISWNGSQVTQAVTATTTNIAFTTINDRAGAWNGTQYVIPVAGDYVVAGSAQVSASATLAVYLNGTAYNNGYFASGTAANALSGGSILVTGCKPGDLISLRCNASVTITLGLIGIWRLSGPSVIAATESVNARYFSSVSTVSGSISVITYATKDFDSHSAYSSGTYTIPVSGKYQINAALDCTGTYAINNLLDLYVYKNGTAVTQAQTNAPSAVSLLSSNLGDIISCNAGDLITIRALNTGATPAISSSTTLIYFSICRVGN